MTNKILKNKKRKIIHVNQHIIKANKKVNKNKRQAPLTTKTYNTNDKSNCVVILDDVGTEVARVVYSPDKPLSCGATCWIETKNEVQVLS